MMENDINREVLLKRAEKKVERVKNFYRHLFVYIVVNIIIFGAIVTLYSQLGWGEINDEDFQYWYKLNLLSTPVLWGIGVLVHGLIVFNTTKSTKRSIVPNFVKEWEEKQIQKYLDKESKN